MGRVDHGAPETCDGESRLLGGEGVDLLGLGHRGGSLVGLAAGCLERGQRPKSGSPRRARLFGSSVGVRAAGPRPTEKRVALQSQGERSVLCAKFRVYTAGGLPKKTGECLLARQAVVGEGIGKPRTSATRT